MNTRTSIVTTFLGSHDNDDDDNRYVGVCFCFPRSECVFVWVGVVCEDRIPFDGLLLVVPTGISSTHSFFAVVAVFGAVGKISTGNVGTRPTVYVSILHEYRYTRLCTRKHFITIF